MSPRQSLTGVPVEAGTWLGALGAGASGQASEFGSQVLKASVRPILHSAQINSI